MKWLNNIFSFNKKQTNDIKTGKIKFFNKRKGYGFIESDQTSKDVFVHATDLEDRVRKGDDVSFELQHSGRGLQAENVKLIK